MIIKSKKSEILAALDKCFLVVNENRIRPILETVKITAVDKVYLTATDLEKSVICELNAEITEQGEAVITREMFEFIKLSDNDTIEIIANGNTISTDTGVFSCYDADDYPEIRQSKAESEVTANTKEFLGMLQSVSFAASKNPASAELNLVRIAETYAASTDRFSMALRQHQTPLQTEISVPLRSVDIIIKLMTKCNSDAISVVISNNVLMLNLGDTKFITRLVDLPFVDINGIMKNMQNNNCATVSVKELQKTLKKIMLIAGQNIETANGAIFHFSGGKLQIEARSEKSKIKEVVGMEYNGSNVKVALNAKYILDFLGRISGDLEIHFSTNDRAFLLQQAGDEQYKFLIMPFQTRDE
jgi:DNA polymerase-3 subunit beta